MQGSSYFDGNVEEKLENSEMEMRDQLGSCTGLGKKDLTMAVTMGMMKLDLRTLSEVKLNGEGVEKLTAGLLLEWFYE